jgi:hypothetical protein
VTHLNGSKHKIMNPVTEEQPDEPDQFDPVAVNREQVNEAASKAEAELAGKIVGVAEQRKTRRDRRDDPGVDTTDEGNQLMSEEEAEEYYINEKVTLGDYSFDIRLKNAVKLYASTIIAATFVVANI